jgi:hypothetical protein
MTVALSDVPLWGSPVNTMFCFRIFYLFTGAVAVLYRQRRRYATSPRNAREIGLQTAIFTDGKGPLWGDASLLPGAGTSLDFFTQSPHKSDSHKG